MPVPLSVPASVSRSTESLKLPMASVAPLATVTTAPLAKRLAAPSVSVPPVMATVVALALPSNCTLPVDVSVPVPPRLAPTVPPLSV